MRDWQVVQPYLTGAAVAHLATVGPDGGPHVTPVWVATHGETDVAFFTVQGSRKDKNLARDPRVALSLTAPGNDYAMATVRGAVVERLEGETAMAVVDAIAHEYTGAEYEVRTGLVAFVIRPQRWTAADYS